MLNSEERNSEAHPECTRTTDIASYDILDKEVVSSHGERSDDKMAVEQHAVVYIALTATICGSATASVGAVDLPSMMSSDAEVVGSNSTWPEVAQLGDLCTPTEGHGRRPEYLVASNVAGGRGSAMHVAPSHDMHEGLILASQGRKLALRVSQCDLAATYEFCYSQVYRLTADGLHESMRLYFVEPQLKKCGATTSPMTLCPKTAELTGRPPTHIRLQRLVDLYRENVLQDINPIKMKRTCERLLSTEEPVKLKGANKEDGWHHAQDIPMAVKSVTHVLFEKANVMPRITPAGSSSRIWDPDRC
jgi:hypothetical protein